MSGYSLSRFKIKMLRDRGFSIVAIDRLKDSIWRAGYLKHQEWLRDHGIPHDREALK